MRSPRWIILPLALSACTPENVPSDPPIEPYDALALVDPMIGTGGVGAEVVGLNPGATVPFGMTQVGPDTRDTSTGAPPFYHFGGYYYGDDQITAFSHEHANGMGTNDFGTIAVLPRTQWEDSYTQAHLRASLFSHEDEVASPGYYAVTLDDDDTRVEIAATTRGAIHRYRFADGSGPIVLLDLGHTLGQVEIGGASLSVDLDAGTVDAFQLLMGNYSSRFGGLQTWAHLSFEPAPIASGVWTDSMAPTPGLLSAEGQIAGTWLTFPAGTEEVLLRVALSHVDADGARGNHAAELEGRGFEQIRAEAELRWQDALGGVRVRGGSDAQRVIFHTALYHAYLWPNIFQDVDSRYRGIDGELHEADFEYHSNFSMWDTFRTTHPWFSLARPDAQRDMARSLVRMYEDGGAMPRWVLAHGYTGGMVGTPAAQILAGTALKGIDGWDAEAGFAACYLHSTQPMPHAGRGGLDAYQELHYVPIEESGGSASLGVEYSWNDHALALWAEQLGKDAEATQMWEQSRWWKNNWDPEQRFVLGRFEDGSFRQGQDPEVWSDDFVEGDAWQYLWAAPQDMEGMIELQHGGDTAAFLERLAYFWNEVYFEPDDLLPDSFYWHGNEPDLHYAWLGSLIDHPEASVEPVRHVMQTRYSTENNGLDGNDDAGTLSSWYLFAALGIYPVGGTPTYALTSPIFERIEIDRPDGTLVVRAPGTSEEPIVPTSITLGGEPLPGSTIEHDALTGGGELVFHYE